MASVFEQYRAVSQALTELDSELRDLHMHLDEMVWESDKFDEIGDLVNAAYKAIIELEARLSYTSRDRLADAWKVR